MPDHTHHPLPGYRHCEAQVESALVTTTTFTKVRLHRSEMEENYTPVTHSLSVVSHSSGQLFKSDLQIVTQETCDPCDM